MTEKGNGLVLLDVNGLLLCKVKKGTVKRAVRYSSYEDVIIRNHAVEFIEKLMSKYDVGIFTSGHRSNTFNLIKLLMGTEKSKKLKFILSREYTKFDPESDDNISTVKILSDVYNNPVVNRNKIYNKYNTLLCDDSEIKTRFNPQENIVIVEKFTDYKRISEDDYLMTLPDQIDERMEQLRMLSDSS